MSALAPRSLSRAPRTPCCTVHAPSPNRTDQKGCGGTSRSKYSTETAPKGIISQQVCTWIRGHMEQEFINRHLIAGPCHVNVHSAGSQCELRPQLGKQLVGAAQTQHFNQRRHSGKD